MKRNILFTIAIIVLLLGQAASAQENEKNLTLGTMYSLNDKIHLNDWNEPLAFQFVCESNNRYYRSGWMDERVSDTVTMERIDYRGHLVRNMHDIFCDTLCLDIAAIDGKMTSNLTPEMVTSTTLIAAPGREDEPSWLYWAEDGTATYTSDINWVSAAGPAFNILRGKSFEGYQICWDLKSAHPLESYSTDKEYKNIIMRKTEVTIKGVGSETKTFSLVPYAFDLVEMVY